MKKYIIEAESSYSPAKVYYQDQHKNHSVWCNDKELAMLFDTYGDALYYGNSTYNIRGNWKVIEYIVNNIVYDAYDRAMKGV